VTPGAIDVDGVSRRFVVRARESYTLKELLVERGRTGAQEIWALRDVSVAIAPGEAVALVGRNGSGKSTLLRLIAGIIKPTEGRVSTGGRVGSLLELGAGFHPDFTGRENVELNGMLQGLGRARIRERFDEIVAFAELEHAIDRPVRTYSSGMTMRLGFAIAAFLEAPRVSRDADDHIGRGGCSFFRNEKMELARSCQAHSLTDRLTDSLRQVGVEAADLAAPPVQLTVLERRAARLASAGVRDEEIALQLFLPTPEVSELLRHLPGSVSPRA